MMEDITDHIIKKFINGKTSISILIFAERFKNDRLANACKDKLKNIFADAKPKSDKAYVEEESKQEHEDKKAARLKEIMVALPYLSAKRFAEIL